MRRTALVSTTYHLLAATALAALLLHCGKPTSPPPLLCEVGGTMRPAMEAIAKKYQDETGQKIDIDYAESGELLVRIEQTRKGDLYVCHDPYLAGALRKHLAVKGWNVSTLDPVIVVAKGNPKGIRGLKDLAAPGMKLIFTHETYHYMGIVPRMADKAGIRAQLEQNCVSYAGGGSEASNELSLGTADAAVVWNVIAALRENNLDVVPIEPQYRLQSGVDGVTSATFGVFDQAAVRVTISTLKCSKNLIAATKFAEYCASDEAQKIWVAQGFSPRRGVLTEE